MNPNITVLDRCRKEDAGPPDGRMKLESGGNSLSMASIHSCKCKHTLGQPTCPTQQQPHHTSSLCVASGSNCTRWSFSDEDASEGVAIADPRSNKRHCRLSSCEVQQRYSVAPRHAIAYGPYL
jgi:hypothetical protein